MRIKEAAIVFEGKVWTGGSHSDIIKTIVLVTKGTRVRGETQGFVTEDGGFFDRVEAGRIALAAGQVKKLRGSMLYSEDLLEEPKIGIGAVILMENSTKQTAHQALASVEQIKKDYWDGACQSQKRGFMFRGADCKCIPCLCDNLIEILREDVKEIRG